MDTLAHTCTVTNMRMLAKTHRPKQTSNSVLLDVSGHLPTRILCTHKDEVCAVGFTHTWEEIYTQHKNNALSFDDIHIH